MLHGSRGRGASGIPKQIANMECVYVKMSNIWAGKHISRENKLNLRDLCDWWNLLFRFCDFASLRSPSSQIGGFKASSVRFRYAPSPPRALASSLSNFDAQRMLAFVCRTPTNLRWRQTKWWKALKGFLGRIRIRIKFYIFRYKINKSSSSKTGKQHRKQKMRFRFR